MFKMLQLINKGVQDCSRQIIVLLFCDEQLTLVTASTSLGMSWYQKFKRVWILKVLGVFQLLAINLNSEAEEV